MVRSTYKAKTVLSAMAIALSSAFVSMPVNADNPQSLQFQVNVEEALTVSITDPATWASGDLSNFDSTNDKYESDFLRNKVTVEAATNNPIGVTLSMYTLNTELRNLTSYSASDATTYIPTLDATIAKSSFPVNHWGYSVDDTDAGLASADYKALSTSAIQLFTTVGTSNVGSGSEEVFFGAKANNDKQSGTYAQTVYFAAVTGTIDADNPAIPVNPSAPVPTNEIASYNANAGVSGGSVLGTTGQTTYTTYTTGSDSTTTSQVTGGDVRTNYAQAAGVTTSGSGVNGLGIALATSAVVAATSGFFFFILAKRRKDDDEEEEEA